MNFVETTDLFVEAITGTTSLREFQLIPPILFFYKNEKRGGDCRDGGDI